MCLHIVLVMDDYPGYPAGEAVSEFPDRGPASLVEHVDAAIQVDHGQARVGGHEAQDMLQLVRRIGVYLGCDAHLGEAEPGELEQRVVPGEALLEQGMNGSGHHRRRSRSRTTRLVEASSSTICFHHSPVTGVFRRVLYRHALRSTLGCPAQLLGRVREAIDHRRSLNGGFLHRGSTTRTHHLLATALRGTHG